ncbi:type VI secretion protein [Streptomyces finlayi]|uniref:Type VI secretion protein n=1 Tax=Streptomyces finlayi TaxID=67296 RepID=A0A7G7BKU3_9ACTN|nr:type IV secretory system conjugative DNA transfer family protein [Streptomyces finlayi]QNE75958.1 type VI secretion protein [Streptomyces finlayi]
MQGSGIPNRQERGTGGLPDGLLVGLLSLLFALTVLGWTATGLAGLLAHGAWPQGVTFTGTPLALRALATAPQNLPGAWPETPPDELSGYGLFWGLFIGELMVLLVLAVFVLGVVTRWRAVRDNRRDERHIQPHETPVPIPEPAPLVEAAPVQAAPAKAAPIQAAPAPSVPPSSVPLIPLVPSPRVPHLVYGPAATRRPAAVQAIMDAEGPVLVVTSDATVWAETKDARGKLGPVLVYDPGHLCDTPARLHWSPTAGCEDPEVAASRSTALLAPVRPQARMDTATADTAETLLQCWLHAAAVDGRPFRQVHRWALGGNAHEAVRLLRTHPRAASGIAGLLESALTAYPERRELAQELTVRAFAALSSVHIREACTSNRADSLALESFTGEGGTLYVVGEAIEDPRTRPGAMPLLTALSSYVVEHGRRLAARSTDGRLDPPMTLVLDDVAAVAPLPRLPELLTTGQAQGLLPLALLRSQEQGRARWRQPLETP